MVPLFRSCRSHSHSRGSRTTRSPCGLEQRCLTFDRFLDANVILLFSGHMCAALDPSFGDPELRLGRAMPQECAGLSSPLNCSHGQDGQRYVRVSKCQVSTSQRPGYRIETAVKCQVLQSIPRDYLGRTPVIMPNKICRFQSHSRSVSL